MNRCSYSFVPTTHPHFTLHARQLLKLHRTHSHKHEKNIVLHCPVTAIGALTAL